MEYIDKETKEIKTYKEIRHEHSEIIHNSSFDDEDIKDINDIDKYIEKFYDEVENEK